MRRFALFGKNFVLTLVSLAVWLAAGYVVGTGAAAALEPKALNYVIGRSPGVMTADLANFYAIRNGIIQFAAWWGLVCAQIVFVIQYSAARIRPADSR